MPYNYNFTCDLEKAKEEEKEAAWLIIKNFPSFEKIKKTLRFNDDNRFDFSFINGENVEITFEVKDDDYTFKSDNVAIEVKCRGKKSGIMATESKYWVHKIKGKFYVFKTSTIREKVDKKEYFRLIENGGDPGSYTNLCLFKQEQFKKWGKALIGE